MSDQRRFRWYSGRLGRGPIQDFWQIARDLQDPEVPNLPLETPAPVGASDSVPFPIQVVLTDRRRPGGPIVFVRRPHSGVAAAPPTRRPRGVTVVAFAPRRAAPTRVVFVASVDAGQARPPKASIVVIAQQIAVRRAAMFRVLLLRVPGAAAIPVSAPAGVFPFVANVGTMMRRC